MTLRTKRDWCSLRAQVAAEWRVSPRLAKEVGCGATPTAGGTPGAGAKMSD